MSATITFYCLCPDHTAGCFHEREYYTRLCPDCWNFCALTPDRKDEG